MSSIFLRFVPKPLTLITGSFIMLSFVVFSSSVFAQGASPCEVNDSIFGIPTWYRGLEFDAECNAVVSYDDFQSDSNTTNPILIIALNIADMIARLAGLIAVIFVIVGGFKYVLSDGEPQKAAEARKTIINATVGAVIVGMASVIVSSIVGALGA